MRIILAVILSWLKSLRNSNAITESKTDDTERYLADLGIDIGNPTARRAAIGLLELYGHTNLVPAQMNARISKMTRKIRKRNKKIAGHQESIAWLESMIARDETAKAGYNKIRKAAAAKREAWS